MTSLFGEIEKVGNGYTLTFERILATDAADLWEAVTTPDRLARWMNVYTGDLRLAGTWQALLDDGSEYCHGTVTECDAPHSFVTTWHAVEENKTVLRVSVDAVEGGARLRLRHDGVQSIYYGPGWQAYLERLDDELGAAAASIVDGSRVPGTSWDVRFTELRPVWDAAFGRLRG
jgi:uncharacterized protein YndB with AHSA1/START domain